MKKDLASLKVIISAAFAWKGFNLNSAILLQNFSSRLKMTGISIIGKLEIAC